MCFSGTEAILFDSFFPFLFAFKNTHSLSRCPELNTFPCPYSPPPRPQASTQVRHVKRRKGSVFSQISQGIIHKSQRHFPPQNRESSGSMTSSWKPFKLNLTNLWQPPDKCWRICAQTCNAISLTHMWSLSMNNLDEYYIEFQSQTARHRHMLWLAKMLWGG